jgi:hypothetical protein
MEPRRKVGAGVVLGTVGLARFPHRRPGVDRFAAVQALEEVIALDPMASARAASWVNRRDDVAAWPACAACPMVSEHIADGQRFKAHRECPPQPPGSSLLDPIRVPVRDRVGFGVQLAPRVIIRYHARARCGPDRPGRRMTTRRNRPCERERQRIADSGDARPRFFMSYFFSS